MKKTLAIVLSVIFTVSLICGMFVMTSSAATVVDSGKLSDTISWSVDDTNTLTITGTGAMPDYAAEADRPYHKYAATIKSIVISDGITVVGRQAFSHFTAVDTISMADSVTTLNGDCFAYCGNVNLIKLSKNVTTIAQGTVFNTTVAKISCYYSWKVLGANLKSLGGYNDAYAKAEWIDVVVANLLVEPASGTINSSISWNLEADGTFTVSGTGAIPNYNSGDDRPYAAYVGSIVRLVVEEGITRIGNRAFTGMSVCDSVTLPDSVIELGFDSFSVSSIGYINLPKTLKKIEQGAFYVSTVGTVSSYYDYSALQDQLTTFGDYNTNIQNSKWVDVVVKGSPLKLGIYGTGFENWSGQTQLLFTPTINGKYDSAQYTLDTVWTLTFSDGTTSQTVNIKPSSHSPQGSWGILRFQPCCEPKNNRFIPQTNVDYTITATVTIGGVTYTTTSNKVYSLKNVEAIVPVEKDEREYQFSQSSFGAFENWLNSPNNVDINGKKVSDAQTQMLVKILDSFGKDASKECFDWTYYFSITDKATGETDLYENIKAQTKIFDNQIRFEPCLWETPFVPQAGATYEIDVEAYYNGELVAYGSYTATSPIDGIAHTEHFAKKYEVISEATCCSEGESMVLCACGELVDIVTTAPDASKHTYVNGACVNCGTSALVILPFNAGMENWSDQTQLLICPKIEGKFDSKLYTTDTVWTITLSDGTTSKTVKLAPSSLAPQGSWGIIRFQPCLGEGSNRFVPEKDVKYTVTVTVTIGGVTYTTTGAQQWCLPDVDPIVPYIPKEGFVTENGYLYYYENDELVSGWFTVDGLAYYAHPVTNVVTPEGENAIISLKQYLWDETKGLVLANGFYENAGTNKYASLDTSNGKAVIVTVSTNGTICFENGYLVYGWRHADGSSVSVVDGVYEQYSTNPQNLYYFLSSTYTMVTSDSYVLGGWTREFNADHTVKPLDGLQNRYGEVYYYVAGTMQDGWQTIDGNTYYFYKGTGKAATKWMIIGEKVYYFYAGSSATPYVLKTSGAIGGINYTYAEDGSITTTGFFNTAYANAANNNAAAYIQYKDGTTMYYENGVRVEGWAQIGGNWYYFYKGTGLMCTESRTIGGVWYEFTSEGVCTSK